MRSYSIWRPPAYAGYPLILSLGLLIAHDVAAKDVCNTQSNVIQPNLTRLAVSCAPCRTLSSFMVWESCLMLSVKLQSFMYICRLSRHTGRTKSAPSHSSGGKSETSVMLFPIDYFFLDIRAQDRPAIDKGQKCHSGIAETRNYTWCWKSRRGVCGYSWAG